MEITLTRLTPTQVTVACNHRPSHTFDLHSLLEEGMASSPLQDPLAYGGVLYQALFPFGTLTREILDQGVGRIVLVCSDDELQAIPWEYSCGPKGFLVQQCPFVRGLPSDERIASPILTQGLHILAALSNPLDKTLPAFDAIAEWRQLKKIIQELPGVTKLECVRPSTLEQLRRLTTDDRQNVVVHFIGQSGVRGAEPILYFENEYGVPHVITPGDFIRRIRNLFLVTLSTSTNALPQPTHFTKFAAALTRQKIPYALGMQYSLTDDDAFVFTQTLYRELARGGSVEAAVLQGRLQLAGSPRQWSVGVPVLYTALETPAHGFAQINGSPYIDEHQPRIEIDDLLRSEGVLQGRIGTLKEIGRFLTGDDRPRILSIRGVSGQGKTALAHEAVERFAYAWPGGVWATTLDALPPCELFIDDLAHFLGVDTERPAEIAEVERLVLTRLNEQRTLIVLDHAETLVEKVEERDADALELSRFIRERLLSQRASLLITTCTHLGWGGEITVDLDGLAPEEGAFLFLQRTLHRAGMVDITLAKTLSSMVRGHPLSLSLLAGAFDVSSLPMTSFVEECEALLANEDKFSEENLSYRQSYAALDISVRFVDNDLRPLLSGLWIFQAPFLPEAAAGVFEASEGEDEEKHSKIYVELKILWQLGLLAGQTNIFSNGEVFYYCVLPIVRTYLEKYMEQVYERDALLAAFGTYCAELVDIIVERLGQEQSLLYVVWQIRRDIERGLLYVEGNTEGYYALQWGQILEHIGYTEQARHLFDRARSVGQKIDRHLELRALHHIALLYQKLGEPKQALKQYEQSLPILREIGERAGEVATLSNMAGAYQALGQPEHALELCEEALPIHRELEGQDGELSTLVKMAEAYTQLGSLGKALELYEPLLPLVRGRGNLSQEARILKNMAEVHLGMGQLQEALELCRQTLPILREIGERVAEASMLNRIAHILTRSKQYTEALKIFEQSIALERQIGHRAGEVAGLVGMAKLLYQDLHRPKEAIARMEQAIATMIEAGLTQSPAGEPVEYLQKALVHMRRGANFGTSSDSSAVMPLTPEEIQQIIDATVKIMTEAKSALNEWSEFLSKTLENSRRANLSEDSEFLIAILSILDGQVPTIRDDHPYAQAVVAIQPRVASAKPVATLPTEQVQQIVVGTVHVMTEEKDRQDDLRAEILQGLEQVRQWQFDQRAEIEFFNAVLAILDGQEPTLLPPHPYAEALATIRAGIALGGVQILSEALNAVNSFVFEEEWDVKRRVVETHRELIFRSGIEGILNFNIARAIAEDDQEKAEQLTNLLSILQKCKVIGIAETFEDAVTHNASAKIPQLDDAPPAIPAEFVIQCVSGLRGTPETRLVTLDYLESLPTLNTHLRDLIQIVETALFGADFSTLGNDLTGIYADAWQYIVKQVSEGSQA